VDVPPTAVLPHRHSAHRRVEPVLLQRPEGHVPDMSGNRERARQ
jgi:hypothetical protein